MAIFLSQWAVADPPVEANPPQISNEDATQTDASESAINAPAHTGDENSKTRSDSSEPAQVQITPALITKPLVPAKLSDKCYEQTDGSFECVCEGEEECKELESAEHCEDGTRWGKDGYGGCTKKADK